MPSRADSMSLNASAPLIAILKDPGSARRLSDDNWSELIASARAANLLGLLAVRLRQANIPLPRPPRRHLDAVAQLSERQCQSVRWEIHCLQRALGSLRVPVVLLKGAAYAMSDHPVSHGRLFGDIDILVPREAIGDVELRLMIAGWTSGKSDAYDQRYYRQWMHELPPMVNVRRGTVLDVHHTILPLTSRHAPDARPIIEAARPLDGFTSIRVPRAEHLLIHSIVHLLHDGELPNGLRDLFDIDGLIRAGTRAPDFWQRVEAAATELGLAAPTALGLTLALQLIGSPVPPETIERLHLRAGKASSPLLHWLYRQALRPDNEVERDVGARIARSVIYLRAHWLRMPAHLLARHLLYKSAARLRKTEGSAAGAA
ncbi:MAG TPA: nucleotidyltransferase family protein [Aromatoleum sp.]|uniref:nucleotidyltransferase domain-containing protein n=1 Tax=Aromatoleum sp. TaxID=2307007 RepID=UPI002B47E2E8|nr:nucleotidyltransferase family protein [Aromatoleum sp.]HJV27082.1 nucleotidyltransferase family protein [Aromatoleum sp.]